MRYHVEKSQRNGEGGVIAYRIKPKKEKSQAKYLGNDPMKDESEVLFPPNTKFKVAKVEKNDIQYAPRKSAPATVIYLEEV